jgi:hypothetical protein
MAWSGAVSKAGEYRQIAKQCREVAVQMSLTADREHMLRTAAEYERRADEMERGPAPGRSKPTTVKTSSRTSQGRS